MRCAIEHKGCWATNLGKSPYVKDLKFWSGLVLDRTRIMGSFLVRASEPLDLLEYNPFPLDYVNVQGERAGEDWIYHVDYVVRDPARKSTINLLFASGCVFQPPASVDGDFEIHNVLALHNEDLCKLQRILKENHRPFRVLSLREVPNGRYGAEMWLRELTPRQLEAIQAAVKGGFYQYPRRARIEDLARQVGLSRSTFQEHLRLAEAKLIRYLLERQEAPAGKA